MKEIIEFLKDIFMINCESTKTGLCQFSCNQKPKKIIKKPEIKKEVKLSDLMRRSA